MRINCSHSDEKTIHKYVKLIRKIEKKVGKAIGIMLDLQGPKFRVGILANPILLQEEETWKLSYGASPNLIKKTIPIDFKNLAKSVEVGGNIYMDDGLIRTEVIRKDHQDVWVKVLHGGKLFSRKGVNIPNYKGRLPFLNKKDRENLLWGLKLKVDFIALSFVRKPQDIRTIRNIVQKNETDYPPMLIAKIEKPEAVENMDKIIQESDGIIVARGDLGIELSMEQVPVAQKQLIERCRYYQKPVIIATQMLDSMRSYPIPTRAEVSDVANSIYAGADAVMLTGETSSGKYPIPATKMIKDIVTKVEDHMYIKTFYKKPTDFGITEVSEAFLFKAMQLADDIHAKAIILLTRRGLLTKVLSKFHPKQPIFSLAHNLHAYRRMSLYWGVFPIEINVRRADKRIEHGLEILKENKTIKKNDHLIFIYWDFQSDNLNMKIVKA